MTHKSIVLFGGAFNPPHLGHRIVIEQALELIPGVDELWLVPCFNHTFQKELAPAADRLAMCNLLINELTDQPISRVKICPIEIDYHTSGSTYETLKLLQSEEKYIKQPAKYSFLMGSDQLPQFTQWQNWQTLLKNMHFYVYPRANSQNEITFPNMTLLESPTQVITNLSSTLIRRRLQAGLPTHTLLPPPISDYLTTHHPYKSIPHQS